MTETQVALVKSEPMAQPADWWAPKTWEAATAMAERMAKSQLVPIAFRGKPDDILVAWSLGAPLGLTLLSSLQHIAVVNGKPSIYGDAALAVCRAHPACELVREEMTGEGDELTATCTVKRAGDPRTIVRSFGVRDARLAGLWGGANVRDADKREASPWVKYPKRMLQMRARSWALRDAFPDALCGMPIAEELRDITDEVTVRDVDPAPEPQVATATERLKHKLRPKGEEPKQEPAPSAPADSADLREDLMFRFHACVHARSAGDDEKGARIIEEIEAKVGGPIDEMPDGALAALVAEMEGRLAKK